MKAPESQSTSPAGADGQSDRPGTLRIAVCSTPRSGNTWLRRLLESLYSLAPVVADTPEEIDWEQIGRTDRCVVQLHWTPEPGLLAKLEEHAFRVVTLTRHPLDLLMSILHFASVWPDTALWFGGRGGDESSIAGATPLSPQFLNYATGERARCLLSISRAWAGTRGCLTARYEDFVEAPKDQLGRLVARLELVDSPAVDAAVEANTKDKLRASVLNHHVWKATPGNWKHLLPQREASLIAAAHGEIFEAFHYTCDADPKLDQRQADANWFGMELATMREEFGQARAQLRQSRDLLLGVDGKIFKTSAKLFGHTRQMHAKLDDSKKRIADLEAKVAELRQWVAPSSEIGPISLALARRLTRLSRFLRKVSFLPKRSVPPKAERRRCA